MKELPNKMWISRKDFNSTSRTGLVFILCHENHMRPWFNRVYKLKIVKTRIRLQFQNLAYGILLKGEQNNDSFKLKLNSESFIFLTFIHPDNNRAVK